MAHGGNGNEKRRIQETTLLSPFARIPCRIRIRNLCFKMETEGQNEAHPYAVHSEELNLAQDFGQIVWRSLPHRMCYWLKRQNGEISWEGGEVSRQPQLNRGRRRREAERFGSVDRLPYRIRAFLDKRL